jgi:hypothetical protein
MLPSSETALIRFIGVKIVEIDGKINSNMKLNTPKVDKGYTFLGSVSVLPGKHYIRVIPCSSSLELNPPTTQPFTKGGYVELDAGKVYVCKAWFVTKRQLAFMTYTGHYNFHVIRWEDRLSPYGKSLLYVSGQ